MSNCSAQFVVFLTEIKKWSTSKQEGRGNSLSHLCLITMILELSAEDGRLMQSGTHWSELQEVENLGSLHSPTGTTNTKTTSQMTKTACSLLF